MIVVVVGLFQKIEDNQHKAHVVSHICYDTESVDDAKRDFLTTDYFLKMLNDNYSLAFLHVHVANMGAVLGACKDAAKAALEALSEVAQEHKKSQEGEEE